MSRFSRTHDVFFIEEPIWADETPRLDITESPEGVTVCVPRLREANAEAVTKTVQKLIGQFVRERGITELVTWFYTPMMLEWAEGLKPAATVYDCMDELSHFRFAPPRLIELEDELFRRADIVFTGGHSLYLAKKERHRSVHEFPSSIDVDHFRKALMVENDPADQRAIPARRVGYAGVIDERIDVELISQVAVLRPEVQFIMIGPVVKIDPESLPQRDNIHYLGQKPYSELPMYFSGWDVGMMPFAMNDSTKFISPTKTPEYLTAGLPVVSTPIADVVSPYGNEGVVHIAADANAFASAIDAAIEEDAGQRARKVEKVLAGRSWDHTFRRMSALIEGVKRKPLAATASAGRSSEIPSILG